MTSKSTTQPLTNISAITLHLAKSRSILANERTLLSYIRTSLTIFVSGISFIRFFDYLAIEVIGWIFIPVAMFVMVVGVKSFRHNKAHIAKVVGNDPLESV